MAHTASRAARVASSARARAASELAASTKRREKSKPMTRPAAALNSYDEPPTAQPTSSTATLPTATAGDARASAASARRAVRCAKRSAPLGTAADAAYGMMAASAPK